jgi:predicted MFS family arabinose efflux permease
MPVQAWVAIVLASTAAVPGNVLPVLAGMLADHYSIDEATIGSLIGANTLAGLLTSATAPYWTSRVNFRYAAAVGFVAIPLALLGLGYAPGLVSLFCAEVFLGAGNIVIASICLTVLAQVDNPARAWSIKISTDVIFAGAFLGLVPMFDLGLTAFVGILAIYFGVVAPVLLKLPSRATLRRSVDGSPEPLRAAPGSAWLALGTMAVFYTSGIAVWTFLERLAVHAGFSRAAASEAIAIGIFVGIIGSVGAALVAGRTRRIWPQTTSGIVFVASVAAIGFSTNLVEFYAAVFVFNCSWNFFTPFVMGLLAASDKTGRLASLVPGTVMIGGVIGPPLAGVLIKSSGYEATMIVMTAIAGLAIASYVGIARHRTDATRVGRSLAQAQES